jgi:hypothetical protein
MWGLVLAQDPLARRAYEFQPVAALYFRQRLRSFRPVVTRDFLPPAFSVWLKGSSARLWSRLGSSRVERLVSLLMLGCIAAGLWFRAQAFVFDVPAFWLDECLWAMNLTERPLVQNLIRPPGFIVISKALAVTLSPTETVLRALPWTAGVIATVTSPLIARRLYTSLASRLFFVAVLALNPCAIDFSSEFKPYSLGLLIHLALIALTLRYVETLAKRDLGFVLGLCLVGCLFAQDLLFAFPGVFLVIAWEAYRNRRGHLVWIAAGALGIIFLLLGQYFLLWRHMPKDGSEYWGNKYNVFYTGKQGGSYLEWSLERYRDMTGFPGIRRNFWQEGGVTFEVRQKVRDVDRVIWLSMHLMGLMVLGWQRRWRKALLIVLPLAVLWTFNALGLWPMGAFRTNIFALSYTTAIAATAFDVPGGERTRWLAPIPMLLVVIAPFFVFEHVWHARKQAFTYDSRFPKLLERLVQVRQSHDKAPLILDRRSCPPFRFYTRFHPATVAAYSTPLAASYDAHCLTDDAQIPEALLARATTRQAVWIVLHTGHDVDRMMRQRRLPELYRISRFEVGPHTVMSFRRRRPPEPPRQTD